MLLLPLFRIINGALAVIYILLTFMFLFNVGAILYGPLFF